MKTPPEKQEEKEMTERHLLLELRSMLFLSWLMIIKGTIPKNIVVRVIASNIPTFITARSRPGCSGTAPPPIKDMAMFKESIAGVVMGRSIRSMIAIARQVSIRCQKAEQVV